MAQTKKSTKANKVSEVQTINTELTAIQLVVFQLDANGNREIEHKLEGINLNEDKLSLDYVVGTCVQRIADKMRFYKRNGSRFLKATKDTYFQVNVLSDGESVQWFDVQKLNEQTTFKLRSGYTSKSNRKLALTILDIIEDSTAPIKVRKASEVE